MPEATEEALEAKEKDRVVAVIIAVLALLLALAEAGAKNAQHSGFEKQEHRVVAFDAFFDSPFY